MVSAAEAAFYLDAFKKVQATRYLNGVGLVLVIYDWIILLERESRTVWKTRWSWTKGIYYNNRIMTIIGLIIAYIQSSDQLPKPLTDDVCRVYMWLMPLLEWFSFFLGTTILTLRIVALYSGHTYVVRFIYCFLCLTWMGTLVAIFHTVHAATQTIKYSNFLHTCATTGRSPAIAWVFITPAIYEFTLFALTLVRAVRDARSKIITTDKRTPFLFIIYRDGFYYFGAIFGVHVWNAYLCATQPMAGVFMGIHFAWGLMSVMTCRIYLNLVQAANRGTETDFVSNIAISTHLGFKTHGTRGTKDRMAVGQGRQGGSVPLTTLNGSTTFGSVAPNRQRSNNPYL